MTWSSNETELGEGSLVGLDTLAKARVCLARSFTRSFVEVWVERLEEDELEEGSLGKDEEGFAGLEETAVDESEVFREMGT